MRKFTRDGIVGGVATGLAVFPVEKLVPGVKTEEAGEATIAVFTYGPTLDNPEEDIMRIFGKTLIHSEIVLLDEEQWRLYWA